MVGSIHRELGGGGNILLGLVMNTSLYLIITGSELKFQQHTGYLPVIPDGSTRATTIKIVQQHKVQKKQFYITKARDDALKQHIIAAFHYDYVEGVANGIFGFANNKALELLNIYTINI